MIAFLLLIVETPINPLQAETAETFFMHQHKALKLVSFDQTFFLKNWESS